MGVYTKYTVKRNVPLPVAFVCPSCKKPNILLNPFSIDATYNDRGTFSKSVVQERKNAAMEYLDAQQVSLYSDVARRTERKRFMDAGYVCKCASCNHVPLWSNFHIKLLDNITIIATFVAIIMALVWVLNLFDGPPPVSELFPALKVFVFGNLPTVVVYTLKAIRIRKMPKECLPKVFKSPAHLKEELASAESDLFGHG